MASPNVYAIQAGVAGAALQQVADSTCPTATSAVALGGPDCSGSPSRRPVNASDTHEHAEEAPTAAIRRLVGLMDGGLLRRRSAGKYNSDHPARADVPALAASPDGFWAPGPSPAKLSPQLATLPAVALPPPPAPPPPPTPHLGPHRLHDTGSHNRSSKSSCPA